MPTIGNGELQHEFGNSSYHLPKVAHEFTQNCLSYNLIKVTNNTACNTVEKTLHTPNQGFHYILKQCCFKMFHLFVI